MCDPFVTLGQLLVCLAKQSCQLSCLCIFATPSDNPVGGLLIHLWVWKISRNWHANDANIYYHIVSCLFSFYLFASGNCNQGYSPKVPVCWFPNCPDCLDGHWSNPNFALFSPGRNQRLPHVGWRSSQRWLQPLALETDQRSKLLENYSLPSSYPSNESQLPAAAWAENLEAANDIFLDRKIPLLSAVADFGPSYFRYFGIPPIIDCE